MESVTYAPLTITKAIHIYLFLLFYSFSHFWKLETCESVLPYIQTASLLCFVVVMVDLALCNQGTCTSINSLQVLGNNYLHKR